MQLAPLVRHVSAVAMCAIVTALSGPANAAPAGPAAVTAAVHDDLARYLDARSSAEHISTLSLTVTFRGGTPPIATAVGSTRLGGGPAVTPDSLFQIGSITKSYTAVLILKLEAAGVLSIDDTVGKWLPQYPAWRNVTIRQLLDMTSGIPTYDDTAAWAAEYSRDPMLESSPAQLTAYVYPAIKTPGAAYAYSNTGYIMAQQIIDASGTSHNYATDLNALFASLGLSNTFYTPYFPQPSVAARLVSGYEVNTDDAALASLIGRDTSAFSLGWAQAAGGIIANPSDVATWIRDLFEGRILPAKQLAELQSLVSIKSGQPIVQTAANESGFGLGVFHITSPAMGTFWAYQGSTIGYRATYAYLVSSGTIISVFTNSQTTAANNTINDVLLPQLFATLKAEGRV